MAAFDPRRTFACLGSIESTETFILRYHPIAQAEVDSEYVLGPICHKVMPTNQGFEWKTWKVARRSEQSRGA